MLFKRVDYTSFFLSSIVFYFSRVCPAPLHIKNPPGPQSRGSNLVGDKGQQRDLTGALDGLSQLALVHGTGAGGAAGI